ncbi:PREDICTED: WD repeat-containing protein 66-like, partial [Amphimedon queenslandica]
MSQDARYLATIGCQVPQVVSVWDWTNERETPVQSVALNPDYGIQTYITFSHNDSSLLASNSDDQVIFYKWTAKGLSVCTTPVSDRDFNKSVGLLSQTVFLPDGSNHWALTGTSEGCAVVWETSGLYHN